MVFLLQLSSWGPALLSCRFGPPEKISFSTQNLASGMIVSFDKAFRWHILKSEKPKILGT